MLKNKMAMNVTVRDLTTNIDEYFGDLPDEEDIPKKKVGKKVAKKEPGQKVVKVKTDGGHPKEVAVPKFDAWDPNFEDPIYEDGEAKNFFAMTICSARKGGKTTIVKHLLAEHWIDQYAIVTIFYPSGNAYEEFVAHGNVKIFPKFVNEQLLAIIATQEAKFEEAKELGKLRREDPDFSKIKTILVVLDDCVENRTRYEESFHILYCRGRHLKMSVVFTTQTASLVSTTMRENSDIFMLLKQNGKQSRDFVADKVLGGMLELDKHVWSKILMAECKDHRSLILDHRSNSPQVYTYKVDS